MVLWIVALTIHAVKHDEDMDQKYNFWYRLLSMSILFGILYKGGFFDVWKQ